MYARTAFYCIAVIFLLYFVTEGLSILAPQIQFISQNQSQDSPNQSIRSRRHLSFPFKLVLPEGVGHPVQLHGVVHPLAVVTALMSTLRRPTPE